MLLSNALKFPQLHPFVFSKYVRIKIVFECSIRVFNEFYECFITKKSTRVGTIEIEKVLKQARVVHNIKSQEIN